MWFNHMPFLVRQICFMVQPPRLLFPRIGSHHRAQSVTKTLWKSITEPSLIGFNENERMRYR